MRDPKYYQDLLQCSEDLRHVAQDVEDNKHRGTPKEEWPGLDARIAQINVGVAALKQLSSPSTAPDPLTHYIVMQSGPGYWGKGKSVDEAIVAGKYLRAGMTVRVIKCDADAAIDDMGSINYYSRCVLGIGKIMKIGGKFVVKGEIGAG